MIEHGPKTLAICAEHWTPAATRCEGCPLYRTCNAPSPTTREGIAARVAVMEAEATRPD